MNKNLNTGFSYNSLPLKNEKLEQKSIITILNYQKGLEIKENEPKRGKGTYGSIFPYLNDTIESGGDEYKEYLSDGLLFVDLDHIKNDKADEIFSNFSKIFGKSVISCFFSASHNLHFLSYSDKIISREDYIRECKKAYGSICSDLLKYYGVSYNELVDLLWDGDKTKDDVFDFHSIKPTQRLFLFPSDYVINTNIESVDFDESIYSSWGWIDNVQGKRKSSGKTSSGNIGDVIEKTKEKYLYRWKDQSNFPVIKRTKGTYDFQGEVYSTANDFRYNFLNTLANIEGVDFSLVQDILPDEHNEVELFAQWNYGVEHGLSLGKFLRYLYINNYIEATEESEAVELYNYKEELKDKDGDWKIIDDGKFIGDSKNSILKVLEQNQTLFIESGCGTGKTTLITKILSEGKALGVNILGFCPLNSILSQSYNAFKLEDKEKTNYNGLGCYFTNFDFIKNQNFVISETKVLEKIKNSGGYIIVDEIHELFEASEYREIMEKFLAFLDRVKKSGVKILAFTGTPFTYHPNLFNKTLKFCRKNVEEKDEYEINIYEGGKGNWSDSVEYILKHQEENTKYIIFNDKDRKYIGNEFKKNVFFDFDDICRANRNYEDLTLRDNSTNILLNTHELPKDIDVFVATSYIKEGVNIEDVESKVIFLSDIENLGDVVSLVQLGGRTRKQKHVINLFVKSLEDFNTSKKSAYFASDRFSECEKGVLYKDYLGFVDSFKSLDDWIKYIKDHRLPVVINKINNIGLGKRQKESKYLKLKDMNKMLNTKLNDSSKKLFQVCSVGAKESIDPDFLENGFLIVPAVSKYYENKLYFGTKKIGKAILRLLNLCEASKIIAENEKDGIDLNKLDLLYDLYNLAEDIYEWSKDLDGVKELKKEEVSIFRENFLYSLMIPYDKKYEIILDHYSNTDPLRLYNSGLLNYTEVEIYDVTKKALLNDPTLIDKVIKKHKIFRLFQKYPRTLAVLLNYFWETEGNKYSTKVQDNWPEIEDIFLDEHSNNILAFSSKQSKNRKGKSKSIIFVIGGKDKIYNSKAEVDKDFSLFGFKKREWRANKKALYNLNEGEVLGNIKKDQGKYVIL